MYGDWYTGCYIWCSKEGHRRAVAPPSPLLAVPNVTNSPSMKMINGQCTNLILFDVALCKRLRVETAGKG